VDSTLCAGRHSFVYNHQSSRIPNLASGVYVYRLDGMGMTLSRKLIILR
jgi:hypothetical protein